MMEELKCKDEYLDDYEEYSLATSAHNTLSGEKHHLDYHLHHHQQFMDDAEDDDLFSRHKMRKLSKYEKCWSGEETEKLIQLWSEQQELYNPSLPAYFDRGKKNLLTKEIAEKLETEEECVRKKMKSLQSYYCQLRRRTINLLDKANAVGGGSLKKPTWPFYDMLEFLNISSGGTKLTMTALSEHSMDDMVSSGSPHSHRSSPLTSHNGKETCSIDGQRQNSDPISMATVYTSEGNYRRSSGSSETNRIRSPQYTTPESSNAEATPIRYSSSSENLIQGGMMVQISSSAEQGNAMRMSDERNSFTTFSDGNTSRSEAVSSEMRGRPLAVDTNSVRAIRGADSCSNTDGEARKESVSMVDPTAVCNERPTMGRLVSFEQNNNRHARTESHQDNITNNIINNNNNNNSNNNNSNNNSSNNNTTSNNNNNSSNNNKNYEIKSSNSNISSHVIANTTRDQEGHVNTLASPHNGRTENKGPPKSLSTPSDSQNEFSASEDSIFGELVAKSIAKVPEGEIKEELKIEIQQLILAAKRKASVL